MMGFLCSYYMEKDVALSKFNKSIIYLIISIGHAMKAEAYMTIDTRAIETTMVHLAHTPLEKSCWADSLGASPWPS